MASPYPWHYSIRWPWYYRVPSIYRNTKITRKPLRQQFKEFDPQQTQRLVFCGDIMTLQGDVVPQLCAPVCELIKSADWFIGNCEAAVGEHPPNKNVHYKFKFHMPRIVLKSIVEQTGLPTENWLLSMANNHTGDAEYKGCLETYDILQDMGITPMGRWQQDSLPLTVVEKGGVKTGVITWTDWMNCEVFPAPDQGAFRRQHVEQQDWKAIKEKYQLDLLIALPHWEYEFQHFPHSESQQRAKKMITKQGIDLLVGIHTPHAAADGMV